MSKVTRRPGTAVKRARKQSEAGPLSPRVQEMVSELHKLCDAIEGGPLSTMWQGSEPLRSM
jgi:hypothetical protein